MWKFYTSVALLLLCITIGESQGPAERLGTSFFFPGFPFPPGMNFPGGLWSLPQRILRPPSSRPRPRPPRPDNRERCPSEGIKLISHPTDCEMYILCVDGEEMTELTCPNGLHFSRITRTCTDPRAAGCEDFEWECPEDHDPTNVVFLPNQEDCTRYYLCWAGTPIPMSCAAGLHWSIFENSCMDPSEAACMFSLMPTQKITPASDTKKKVEASVYIEKGVSYGQCPPTGVDSIPNPESCEHFFLCVNGARFDRECPTGQHFSPHLRRCADPDIAECELGCPSTGLAFLPHEDDCNLYYICFNGMRTLMTCPNDLHWSTENNRCMNPDEAGCEEGAIECPATGIEQIPDPEDCERFILCINGFEIPLSCGPGLHFSPSQRQCMSPEDAECEEQNQWKCPEEDTPGVIVFIPNTEDCTMYYLCWQGNQIPLRCGAGLHWSITENRCLPPDQAECPWADDDIEKCPEEGIIAISHPESCEKYILCVNGHEVERDCPFGLHFSRELRNCAHPLIANCIQPANYAMPSDDDATCPTLNSSHDIAFMPNKDDCNSYFLCYNDDSKLFNCAKGLQFDMNLRKCMKKNKAHCVIQS